MKHQVHCKICRKPITVETSDNYPRDPLKLLPMAICNACGDQREQVSSLERKIFRACRMIELQPRMQESSKSRIREALMLATNSYATVIANAYKASRLWETDFVDLLMEQPGKAGIILSKYRADVQRHAHQVSSPNCGIPHKD